MQDLDSCLMADKGIRYKAHTKSAEVISMGIELVHIGFNNIIVINRVIAIASPNSAPTKRTIHEARNKGLLIDMTNGRRTKAAIVTDSGHIILAALTPETIGGRLQANKSEAYAERGGSLLKLGQSDEKSGL
jgi:regulator of extracellular matrix RemA (YlzA/DUF370 family)